MKLIKNFKIVPRMGYIFRELKRKKIDISEDELSQKLVEIQQKLKMATVYGTFHPAVFGEKVDFGKSIAVSLISITLGSEIETTTKDEVTETILKDCLDVAKNFVLKLIELESEKEHCMLAESTLIEPSVVFENGSILQKMDFSKIGVKFDNDVVFPSSTRFVVVGWFVKKKK